MCEKKSMEQTMGGLRTRICDLDLDIPAAERRAVKLESPLQAIDVGELGVAETLGAVGLAVLDQADAGDVAAVEEIADIGLRDLVVEVTEVGKVRRLIRDTLGNWVAVREAWTERVSG